MNQIYIYIFEYKKEGGIIMPNLILDNEESLVLKKMIARAEAENQNMEYEFDPGFASYSCSCTAHKKSCGWD